MAMLIKNKTMAFSLILMCLIVVSPMANAQLLSGLLTMINAQGIVMCSINGSVSTNNATVIPPFAGVPVVLQCAGQNVSTTTTGVNGMFSFPTNAILPTTLSTLLASRCNVIVTAPLSRCNASLPTTGSLTAPLNLAGTTVTNTGLIIVQLVNGLFRLIV